MSARWMVPGALLLAALPGCEININGIDRDIDVVVFERFSLDLETEGVSGLRIEGVNGDIRVVGDPSVESVVVEGTKRVGSDSRRDAERWLDRVDVRVATGADAIAIETHHPGDTDGREVRVDYEVRVPPDLWVRVTQVNGSVEVRSLDSDATVEQTNGEVDLSDIVGSAEVVVVNGTVDAEILLPLGGVIDIRLTNGDLNLDVPVEVSAELDASVTNGTVTVSNLTLINPVVSTRSVSATLGDGDGLIDLRSVNGTIRVGGF